MKGSAYRDTVYMQSSTNNAKKLKFANLKKRKTIKIFVNRDAGPSVTNKNDYPASGAISGPRPYLRL
jgi:hypothetical protein